MRSHISDRRTLPGGAITVLLPTVYVMSLVLHISRVLYFSHLKVSVGLKCNKNYLFPNALKIVRSEEMDSYKHCWQNDIYIYYQPLDATKSYTLGL